MKIKKIKLFALFLMMGSLSLSAQTWFEIGVRGQIGATALLPANLSDNDLHTMKINSGYSYGPTFNVNFGDNNGIALEALFASSEQTYEFDGAGLLPADDNIITWKSTDVYLLYRTMSQGAYLEIGPKLSLVNEVEQEGPGQLGDGKVDVSQFYTDQHIAGVLGFGMYLAGSDVFTLNLGFRVEYSFQDFVSDEGRDNVFPYPFNYDATMDSDNLSNINAYGTVELRFPIGGIAKAQCGQRRFIFGG